MFQISYLLESPEPPSRSQCCNSWENNHIVCRLLMNWQLRSIRVNKTGKIKLYDKLTCKFELIFKNKGACLVIEVEVTRILTSKRGKHGIHLKPLLPHCLLEQILVLTNSGQASFIDLLMYVEHWAQVIFVREKMMLITKISKTAPWTILWNTVVLFSTKNKFCPYTLY